jgi:hypothetical protein
MLVHKGLEAVSFQMWYTRVREKEKMWYTEGLRKKKITGLHQMTGLVNKVTDTRGKPQVGTAN